MIRFGLFGAGVIGSVHADNIIGNPRTTLTAVYDPDELRSKAIAERCGAHLARGVDDLLAQSVDAVLIASATPAHAEQLTRSAEAGKAVLCEKPIHNDVEHAWPAVRAALAAGVPSAMGFNRRYAQEHALLKEAVTTGRLGQLEVVHVVCRTPGQPALDHLQGSRGIYNASTVHFFDLACWIAGEQPSEVFAYGATFLPSVAAVGETDTTMMLMKLASGAIVGINNSYGAPYGYDERIEVMGSKAMAQSDCKPLHEFRIFDDVGRHGSRLVDGWYAHMEHTYMDELNAFVDVLEGKPQTNATLIDGLRAQIIAEAAHVSQRENRPVALDWAEVEELERGL